MMQKSVKSISPCLARRQACKSVVQTCYDIVKAHGGTITVESLSANEVETENVGTEFKISLPLEL